MPRQYYGSGPSRQLAHIPAARPRPSTADLIPGIELSPISGDWPWLATEEADYDRLMTHPTTPREKALRVNLDSSHYGTFAEIGAGQEVVRWFFRAGGAAGTISKSISAYDMKVSDAIYGRCARYVCRERLQAMLDHEQQLNLERLVGERGSTTGFFAFADTVSARNYKGTNECHGWMGICFQARPMEENSQIIIHVRMKDIENPLQAEALGIIGVNLIYGACFLHEEPETLLKSLLDSLSIERIEIDLIEFSGAAFKGVDNRVMSLRLVQLGLTGAAMFAADGRVLAEGALETEKIALAKVESRNTMPPFNRYGDWFVALCGGLVLITLLPARR